jgi:FKBP-type peptidyl-prolyl cis-trans isomerase FkpA
MKSSRWLIVLVVGGMAAGCGSPAKRSSPESGEVAQAKESTPTAQATDSSHQTVKPVTPPAKETPPIQQVSASAAPAKGGVKIEEIRVGTGLEAKKGDVVIVNYTGWLAETHACFDSSINREPFKFVLGKGEVIKGWDEGVVGMKVGGKRQLTIPAKLAYGDKGQGMIPPNADLLFDVELINVLK